MTDVASTGIATSGGYGKTCRNDVLRGVDLLAHHPERSSMQKVATVPMNPQPGTRPRHLQILPGGHTAYNHAREATAYSLVHTELLRRRAALQAALAEQPNHPALPTLQDRIDRLQTALNDTSSLPDDTTAVLAVTGSDHRDAATPTLQVGGGLLAVWPQQHRVHRRVHRARLWSLR